MLAGEVVELAVPTRAGYFFTGWYMDRTCTTTFSGAMPYADLTIYAGWHAESENGYYRIDGDHAVLIEYLQQ